jgi:hypothetical protein
LKPVLNAHAFTVTLLGTVTAGLLLLRLTTVLRPGLAVRYTEQGSVPDALYEAVPHETLLSEAVAAHAPWASVRKRRTVRIVVEACLELK